MAERRDYEIHPFAVKDCALVALATGRHAYTLRELRDHLETVPASSIYHHFWGGMLYPRFEEPEYNNDFAAWARWCLHDPVLAERLAVVDPTEFPDIEGLRRELIEIIEERIYESELVASARAEHPFHFLRSQIVVFDTGRRIAEPRQLAAVVPRMSMGSVFYHFIDARRRTPGRTDDFRAWLEAYGDAYAELCGALAGIDPYFIGLAELRRTLSELFLSYFGAER